MKEAACSCRVMIPRMPSESFERQHEACGALPRPSEGGLDADTLEALDDGFVDPHVVLPIWDLPWPAVVRTRVRLAGGNSRCWFIGLRSSEESVECMATQVVSDNRRAGRPLSVAASKPLFDHLPHSCRVPFGETAVVRERPAGDLGVDDGRPSRGQRGTVRFVELRRCCPRCSRRRRTRARTPRSPARRGPPARFCRRWPVGRA